MNIDLYIFNVINGLAGKWKFLDFIGIFFGQYFEYFLLVVLIIFLIINFKKYWRMITEALLSAIFVRFMLVEIIRKIWFRPRPFVSSHVHLLLPNYNPHEASFPSGHASFYFALSTILYCYNKKLGILFYIGSFLIVISRVFVGIHWPSDILAGALLGIIIGLILNKLFKRINLFS